MSILHATTPAWTTPSADWSFDFSSYRWYVDSDDENVTDPWGNPNVSEDTKLAILPATHDPPGQSDEIRLRVAITVGTANPNAADVAEAVEYDFHIAHNGAADANSYSFRVVESDGTELDTYTRCPTLKTDTVTSLELRHGNVFADEIEQGFVRVD